jgi:hypothetical protein
MGNVHLAAGAYAVVKCAGEDFFRGILTEPARLGEAGGHAGLAAEHAVVFAGEIYVGEDMKLVAWCAVSGTYQIPLGFAAQSRLPLPLYWKFIEADRATSMPAPLRLHMLRGGHALLPPELQTIEDDLDFVCEDAALFATVEPKRTVPRIGWPR